jgi:hypothetical protein
LNVFKITQFEGALGKEVAKDALIFCNLDQLMMAIIQKTLKYLLVENKNRIFILFLNLNSGNFSRNYPNENI